MLRCGARQPIVVTNMIIIILILRRVRLLFSAKNDFSKATPWHTHHGAQSAPPRTIKTQQQKVSAWIAWFLWFFLTSITQLYERIYISLPLLCYTYRAASRPCTSNQSVSSSSQPPCILNDDDTILGFWIYLETNLETNFFGERWSARRLVHTLAGSRKWIKTKRKKEKRKKGKKGDKKALSLTPDMPLKPWKLSDFAASVWSERKQWFCKGQASPRGEKSVALLRFWDLIWSDLIWSDDDDDDDDEFVVLVVRIPTFYQEIDDDVDVNVDCGVSQCRLVGRSVCLSGVRLEIGMSRIICMCVCCRITNESHQCVEGIVRRLMRLLGGGTVEWWWLLFTNFSECDDEAECNCNSVPICMSSSSRQRKTVCASMYGQLIIMDHQITLNEGWKEDCFRDTWHVSQHSIHFHELLFLKCFY